jgi:hypothetical protein
VHPDQAGLVLHCRPSCVSSSCVGDIENRPKTDIYGHQIKKVTPTNQHCGHSATVIITVSNPHTKAIIASVVYMS